MSEYELKVCTVICYLIFILQKYNKKVDASNFQLFPPKSLPIIFLYQAWSRPNHRSKIWVREGTFFAEFTFSCQRINCATHSPSQKRKIFMLGRILHLLPIRYVWRNIRGSAGWIFDVFLIGLGENRCFTQKNICLFLRFVANKYFSYCQWKLFT